MPIQYLSSNRQSGFSLLEALVAATLLSIALLGLASLQTSAIRFNQNAYNHTQASILGNNVIERMRANRRGALDGDYVFSVGGVVPSAPNCTTQECTPTQIARYDLVQWLTQVRETLPEGDGLIKLDDNENIFDVVVLWRDPTVQERSAQCPDEISTISQCVNFTFKL